MEGVDVPARKRIKDLERRVVELEKNVRELQERLRAHDHNERA